MIIQLMGPQGCGKGTEGALLTEELGIPLFGPGELFRNLSEKSPYFKKAKDQTERGVLVDNDITAAILKERIAEPDCVHGYILDGYTRELEQLNFFDPHPDWVIYLNVPREVSLYRLSGRRTCDVDGEIYNIYTMSPERLKMCKGKLIQREDDTEEAVRKRLEIFDRQTTPVLEKYRKDKILLEINGVGTPEQVHARVMSALEVAEKMKISGQNNLGYNK
jgi:adenylate kinase